MKAVLKHALEECLDSIPKTDDRRTKRAYEFAARALRTLKYLEQLPDKFHAGCHVFDHGGLMFSAQSPEELHKLREALREVFGTWEDKLSSIWHVGSKQMIASYQSPLGIDLWLYFKVDDVPAGLLKEGCHIEKETSIETDYSVVCEVPHE